MRFARCSPVLVLAALLAPALARGAWLPGGNRIGDGVTSGGIAATASGPERIIVAWTRPVAQDRFEVRAQAWTADGDLVTGWPSAGAVVGQIAGTTSSVEICADGAGGAFVAWVRHGSDGSSAHLQHLSAIGSPVAGWPAEGVLLSESWPSLTAVEPDGAGGVFVGLLERPSPSDYSYQARVRNIDAAGVPAPAWPVDGLVIPNTYGVSVAVDSEGHVFVSAAEYEPGQTSWISVRRLDGSATPDPGWPQGGALFANVFPALMRIFPDGAGGVFAGWTEFFVCVDRCPPPARLTARVLGDGSRDDRWIPSPRAYANAPDGAGGVLLGLVNRGRPSVTRLGAAGALMPGWDAEGNPAMTEAVGPWQLLVTGDGAGGAFIAWPDGRTGEERLYASRLTASGRLADGWPHTGSFVGTTHGFLSSAQLVSLGAGVTIAVWEEWTPSGPIAHLTALRPGEPGPIARLGPVAEPVGFGVVQVRPNPAVGPIVAMVELPNEGPARLDLVDAAGRVLETQDFDFQWQARGAAYFNRGRGLPAGVYWLRLSQGLRLASRKVVVLE